VVPQPINGGRTEIINENSRSYEDHLKSFKKVLELLKGKLRSNIFLLLLVHGELSLTRLCEVMGKPKTTVFHHVSRLIETGLIMKEKRGKDVYYSIRIDELSLNESKVDGTELFKLAPPDQRSYLAELFTTATKSVFSLLTSSIALAEECQDKRLKEFKKLDPVAQGEEGAYDGDFGLELSLMIYSDERYKQFEEEYKELIEKYAKTFEKELKERGNNKERPYIVYHIAFPIKKMLEYQLGNNKAK
jgi:DNA-binding transcriptional ArsR family regulator